MAYTNFKNGLNIQTAAAIDKRMYLTKAEMLSAHNDLMLPDSYLAICADDGKLYLYNTTNEINETTGKYRLIDDCITFTSTESAAVLNTAVENSEAVSNITNVVGTAESGLVKDVADLQQQVSDITSSDIDGGEVIS